MHTHKWCFIHKQRRYKRLMLCSEKVDADRTTNYISHLMTKQTQRLCAQRRLRSAWASAQSGQSSQCAQWVAEDPMFFSMRTAKTLIRLGRCLAWSEFSLAAHSFCRFCHEVGHDKTDKMSVRSPPPYLNTDRSNSVLLLWFLTCFCCPYLCFSSPIMWMTYFS